MNERLIELGLLEEKDRRDGPEHQQYRSVDHTWLGDRLLAVVADTAVESDALRTHEFRAKVEEYRRRLANSVDGDPATALAASECLRVCQEYLSRARAYLLERETEFVEVIDVMRIAIVKLAADSKSFNVRLLGNSERFNRLTDIEDIRELKKHIAHEVRELNRVVVDKQKQDDLNYAKLTTRIEVLRANLNRTKEQASLDPLTRIANRGSFDDALVRWIADHKQNQKTFLLAMLDIDDFKQINDVHGHPVGDRVLYCAAQRFGKIIGPNDFLARYGGEEFVVMLTDCELSQAEARFTDLLAKIAQCNYEYQRDDENLVVSFTVSCGLAEFVAGDTGEALLRRADEALYVAKRTGKCRVSVARKPKGLWRALKPFVPRARG